MNTAKKFLFDGEDIAREPYHYRACGLDDVYLMNGFTVEETGYGRGVSVHNVDGLHRAIGWHLICGRKRLSAREFRFLRKQMGFTQDQLAKRLRVDVQTVARYEKDQAAIPGAVDAIVRVLYAIYLIPEDRRMEVLTGLVDELEDREDSANRTMYFRQTNEGWDHGMTC